MDAGFGSTFTEHIAYLNRVERERSQSRLQADFGQRNRHTIALTSAEPQQAIRENAVAPDVPAPALIPHDQETKLTSLVQSLPSLYGRLIDAPVTPPTLAETPTINSSSTLLDSQVPEPEQGVVLQAILIPIQGAKSWGPLLANPIEATGSETSAQSSTPVTSIALSHLQIDPRDRQKKHAIIDSWVGLVTDSRALRNENGDEEDTEWSRMRREMESLQEVEKVKEAEDTAWELFERLYGDNHETEDSSDNEKGSMKSERSVWYQQSSVDPGELTPDQIRGRDTLQVSRVSSPSPRRHPWEDYEPDRFHDSDLETEPPPRETRRRPQAVIESYGLSPDSPDYYPGSPPGPKGHSDWW
ncbi:hypothetical protein MMC28_009030 [Mycoblastus sanguinarius]|nr:hypothetical protein [Mycoblastus sanguinarius]